MFYTRAMAPNTRYPLHDLVSGLAAGKQLTPLALSWTYDGTRVVDLLLDGGADATARLQAAGCANATDSEGGCTKVAAPPAETVRLAGGTCAAVGLALVPDASSRMGRWAREASIGPVSLRRHQRAHIGALLTSQCAAGRRR